MAEDRELISIRAFAHGGAGVGQVVSKDGDHETLSPSDSSAGIDTRTVFVDGALPDEEVEVSFYKEARRYRKGVVERVVKSSEFRVSAPCSYAAECGGCGWQMVDAKKQAEFKAAIVEGQLRKLGLKVDHFEPSPEALAYRRRARLHFERVGDSGLKLGFRRSRSHELVDVQSCIVLEPLLDQVFQELRGLTPFLPEKGEIVGVCNHQEAVVGFAGVRPTPELESAAQELIGRVEKLVGCEFRGGRKRLKVGRTQIGIDGTIESPDSKAVMVDAFSFSQAQAAMNRRLVDYVAGQAAVNSQTQTLLELHAGSGNFTRLLGPFSKRVVAVETDKVALKRLEQLARKLDFSVQCKRGDAGAQVEYYAGKKKEFDVVVLDPPRGGLGVGPSALLTALARHRIIYVSCDPATLARDLEAMTQRGFKVEALRVFDMMPMTPEVESVVTLVRGGRVDKETPAPRVESFGKAK